MSSPLQHPKEVAVGQRWRNNDPRVKYPEFVISAIVGDKIETYRETRQSLDGLKLGYISIERLLNPSLGHYNYTYLGMQDDLNT